MTLSDGTPAHSRINFLFLATRIAGVYFATNDIGLASFKFFSGVLSKTTLFLREGRFGRSRASKVTDIGANRKHVCDFLLVTPLDRHRYI